MTERLNFTDPAELDRGTDFEDGADVAIHAGNPNLIDLDEARILRRKAEYEVGEARRVAEAEANPEVRAVTSLSTRIAVFYRPIELRLQNGDTEEDVAA